MIIFRHHYNTDNYQSIDCNNFEQFIGELFVSYQLLFCKVYP